MKNDINMILIFFAIKVCMYGKLILLASKVHIYSVSIYLPTRVHTTVPLSTEH